MRGWLRDGNPAPGAYVIAAANERRWEDVARTGDDGSFSLEVVGGRYDIYLSLAATGCVVSRRDGLPHVGVLVVMGSDVAGLKLRLPCDSRRACAGACATARCRARALHGSGYRVQR